MSDGTAGTIDDAFRERLESLESDHGALEEDQLGLNNGFSKLTSEVGALSKDMAFLKGAVRLLAVKLGVDLSTLEGH